MSHQEIKKFEKLLEDFRKLPKVKPKPKTLLEVTHFPHSELACSNILAFFLDPNEEHGLHDLVLKSLIIAANAEFPTYRLQSVSVHREVRTDSNKSMDLVIESESFVIGIENKINAEPYNPFKEYSKRLKKIAGKKQLLKILLSLRPEPEERSGFKPVTYDTFFRNLRSLLGQRLGEVDQRWLGFLVDFITTIENLGGSPMDEGFVQFVQGNSADSLCFYRAIEELRKGLHQRVQAVRDEIKFKLPKVGFEQLGFWAPVKEDDDFFDCVYVYADLGTDLKIYAETKLYLSKGWKISCGSENLKAEDWLVRNGIVPKNAITKDKQWISAVYDEFAWNTEPEVVAKKYQELIHKIDGAIRKKS